MATIISTSVSNEIPGYWHGLATDGKPNTFWNGGDCRSGSVIFELILDKPVNKIKLRWTPQRTPPVGFTEIQFLLLNDSGVIVGMHQDKYNTTSGVQNEIDFPCTGMSWVSPAHGKSFSRIRLNFVDSDSWAALQEISVA